MGSETISLTIQQTLLMVARLCNTNSKGTGMMTLGEALNYSRNIPAYWTYRMLRERVLMSRGIWKR